MQFLNSEKILCISPHPDDTELSISGSIMKFNHTKFDILCLTSGSKGDPTSSTKRLDEVRNFWNGVTNVKLIFSDNHFSNEKSQEEWLNYIDKILDNENYDMIICPSKIDSHFEHILFYNVCLAAIRHRSISFLTYNTISTQRNWIPNIHIDITENFNTKWEKLTSSFTSQKKHRYFDKETFESFHTDFLSRKKGLKYTEHFCNELIFS